jgi:hypothetical protein
MSLKLIVANGRELAVYDIAGPIYPVRYHGRADQARNDHLLLEDEEARELVRQLVEAQKDEGRRMATTSAQLDVGGQGAER